MCTARSVSSTPYSLLISRALESLFLVSCCSYGCCGGDVGVEWESVLVSRGGLGSLLCWAHRTGDSLGSAGPSVVHHGQCAFPHLLLSLDSSEACRQLYPGATALHHSSARAAGPVPAWAVARNK